MSTTDNQSKAKLLHELNQLPQDRLAKLILEMLDTVQAKRDRAFINMIKTSASKDKGEDEKAFYMGQHKSLHDTYTQIVEVIARAGLEK